MFSLKESIKSLIKIEFTHKYNQYAYINIFTKENLNLNKVDLYMNNKLFAKGILFEEKIHNNDYIYTYVCINTETYENFYNHIKEKNIFNITNNNYDNENGFLYIDPLNHQCIINHIMDNNYINSINLNEYESIISNKIIKFNQDLENVEINLFYPIIEINQELEFVIPINEDEVNIINYILQEWSEEKKKKILYLHYDEENKHYVCRVNNKLYTQRILRYNYMDENLKNKITININYEELKFKPKFLWPIIENYAYNCFIYNNFLCELTVIFTKYIKNLYLYNYIEYNHMYFKIMKIKIIQTDKIYVEVKCKLYLNISKKIYQNQDNSILESNYSINLKDIFIYNEDELIFQESIKKNYIYTHNESVNLLQMS